MSHFSVLVITDEKPTKSILSKALAPWHEFECTGRDDEFVRDVDKTDELREEFADETRRRLRAPDGALRDPYDDFFYRDPTEEELQRIGLGGTGSDGDLSWTSKDWQDGRGYRARVRFIPDGFEEVELPAADVMSFAEFIEDWSGLKPVAIGEAPDLSDRHKYGYVLLDADGTVVKAIDRTNPDAKWDWWVIGGRYSGRFAVGYDPRKDEHNFETCFICRGTGKRDDELGREFRARNPEYRCNGCDGIGKSLKHAPDWVDRGNQACFGDLDLAALKRASVADRREIVEEIRIKFGGTFAELDAAHRSAKAAHKVWLILPEPKPRGGAYHQWLLAQPNGAAAVAYVRADTWDSIEPRQGQSIEEWIEEAPAISSWAVVKDGTWTERGTMGWFGMSSGDQDEHDWQQAVASVIASLPPTAWLTVVDCHI